MAESTSLRLIMKTPVFDLCTSAKNPFQIASLLLCFLMWTLAPISQAQPRATLVSEKHKDVTMEVGETKLMRLTAPIVRVSIADPEVADVQVVTPEQVLITAKSVGFTHLILWSTREEPLVVAVSCTRNLDQLRAQFEGLFPETDIQVSAVGDLIVLSGTVNDLRLPSRAAEVAQLHSEKVANLIQVTGDQQVQLDVRFAEVSRSGLRKMGTNILFQDNARGLVAGEVPPGSVPGSYLNTTELWVPGTNGNSPPFVGTPDHGGAFNFLFSTAFSRFPFSAILSILAQEGLAKVLAEPTLTALSGQEATFHSGGEVPILIAQALGSTSVKFKKFGVLLKFSPTVLGERIMSLKLGLEVSEPDPTAGVSLNGNIIPGFRTRNSETTIRLRDGQSFAVAGLLSDQSRSVMSKVPWLGDLPILGALFRSTNYQRQETELLMVVTAHLVKPLQPGEVPIMPGEDEFNDPSDFELFVLGSSGFKKRKQYERGRPPEEDPTSPFPFRKAESNDLPKQAPEGKKVSKRAADAERSGPPPASNDRRAKQALATSASGSQSQVHPHEGPIGPIGFIRD